MDSTVQRYYSPVYGRFTSADKGRQNASLMASRSWNAYAYGNGDPANQVDPSRRLAIWPDADDPSWDTTGGPPVCNPGSMYYDPASCFGSGGGGGGGDGKDDSHPTRAQPECFAYLKIRPVNDPIASLGSAAHAFWWVQDVVGGTVVQDIVSAGPQPYPGSSRQYLQAWVAPGSANGADNSSQHTAWGMVGPTEGLCRQVEALLAAADSFPKRCIYYIVTGPNSNSAAHYFGNAAGFSPADPLYVGGIAYGWNTGIIFPGAVKTAGPSLPPIVRPVRPLPGGDQ